MCFEFETKFGKRGNIKLLGRGKYFEGDDSCYNVEKPGKGLAIHISLKDNSHNSDAKVLGYWGIYKQGIKASERGNNYRYYEIKIVDADSNQHIDSVYIDVNDMQSDGENIKIMPYLQKTLGNESGQSVKWAYNDGTDEKEVDSETTLATKRGPITVIIKKVKAIN